MNTVVTQEGCWPVKDLNTKRPDLAAAFRAAAKELEDKGWPLKEVTDRHTCLILKRAEQYEAATLMHQLYGSDREHLGRRLEACAFDSKPEFSEDTIPYTAEYFSFMLDVECVDQRIVALCFAAAIYDAGDQP